MSVWRKPPSRKRIPDGKTGDTLLFTRPHLPSPHQLWCWLRQGRPRDFPVVTRRGTLVARVPADWSGDHIPSDHFKMSGWAFAHGFQPAGVTKVADLVGPLIERYGVTAQWPDGTCRHYWPTVLTGDDE